MADTGPIDRARASFSERAELPGMSLMEHLEELRKRIMRSLGFLMGGFVFGWIFRVQLYGFIKRPLDNLHLDLYYNHPIDPINLYIKTALVGGAILASPFILYQVWLFISPGMYANEKKYVFPFMGATVSLFLAGAWFGYHYVFENAIRVLVFGFGKGFHPILIFFLALFGIVDAKFLLRHFRYAVLVIFLVAAIICPMPDPISMCLFASPMLALYFLGVAVAYFVHPDHRKRKEKKPAA